MFVVGQDKMAGANSGSEGGGSGMREEGGRGGGSELGRDAGGGRVLIHYPHLEQRSQHVQDAFYSHTPHLKFKMMP